MDAQAICNFKGLSSLKGYLFKILNFRIVDNIRRAGRKSACQNNVTHRDNDIDDFGGDGVSPEKDVMDIDDCPMADQISDYSDCQNNVPIDCSFHCRLLTL